MLPCAVVTSDCPVTFAFVATVQVYVVPVGTMFPDPFVGATVNAVELQIVGVCAATNGFGSTVTVVVNDEPTHEPDVGVTV